MDSRLSSDMVSRHCHYGGICVGSLRGVQRLLTLVSWPYLHRDPRRIIHDHSRPS